MITKDERDAAKLSSKANRLMIRLENSVSVEARPGWVVNGYGDYYDPAKLEKVLELMEESHDLFPERGDAKYVRAGYLAWAGRWQESLAAYEEVASLYQSHSLYSLLFMATANGKLGRWDEAKAQLAEYNERVLVEKPFFPQQTFERLGFTIVDD